MQPATSRKPKTWAIKLPLNKHTSARSMRDWAQYKPVYQAQQAMMASVAHKKLALGINKKSNLFTRTADNVLSCYQDNKGRS